MSRHLHEITCLSISCCPLGIRYNLTYFCYHTTLQHPPLQTLIFGFLEKMQLGTQWHKIEKANPTPIHRCSVFPHSHLSPGLNASLAPLLAAENRVLANVDTLLPQNAICCPTLCSDNGKEQNSSKQLCSNNCAQRNDTTE